MKLLELKDFSFTISLASINLLASWCINLETFPKNYELEFCGATQKVRWFNTFLNTSFLWVVSTSHPTSLTFTSKTQAFTRRKFIFGSFLLHSKFFLNSEAREQFLYGRVLRQNKRGQHSFYMMRKYKIRKTKLYGKLEIGYNTWKKKYSEIKRACVMKHVPSHV